MTPSQQADFAKQANELINIFGLAPKQAAARLGTSLQPVYKYLHKFGYKFPDRRGLPFDEAKRAAIIEDYKKGKDTVKDIADFHRVSQLTVTNLAKKAGLRRKNYIGNPHGYGPYKKDPYTPKGYKDVARINNTRLVVVGVDAKMTAQAMADDLGVTQKEFVEEAIKHFAEYLKR